MRDGQRMACAIGVAIALPGQNIGQAQLLRFPVAGVCRQAGIERLAAEHGQAFDGLGAHAQLGIFRRGQGHQPGIGFIAHAFQHAVHAPVGEAVHLKAPAEKVTVFSRLGQGDDIGHQEGAPVQQLAFPGVGDQDGEHGLPLAGRMLFQQPVF